jgi:UDP-N-acetylmuramoyl-tripeptide--D-alanyl-D-alanine ligase
MSWLNLRQIAAYAQGQFKGNDAVVSGVSTDTRSLKKGDLFVALTGPNFDGHDYVAQAIEKGAAVVMVARDLDCAVPQVIVADTRLALGNLAAGWRQSIKPVIVGLTGSNGKTTVKEMLSAILKVKGRVLATRGNLNNDIGMPLTVLGLRPEHDFAVIEMGANHHGEIRYLARIADPDIALITNAAPAHLEGFGDLDGVARGKGELFEELRSDALAIINHDDAYFEYWRGCLEGQKTLSFGMNPGADVWGTYDEQDFVLHYGKDEIAIRLLLGGGHNRMNALAAAAAAIAAGIGLDQIRAGLESMQPVAGRLQSQEGRNGARIIDDTYNANPGSLQAAIDYLAEIPGQRWLVMGNMAELGERGDELHQQAGEMAARAGLDRLYTLGALARHAAESFGPDALAFDDRQQMIAALQSEIRADVTVLVKGSRSMAMEEVVKALVLNAQQDTGHGREHAA